MVNGSTPSSRTPSPSFALLRPSAAEVLRSNFQRLRNAEGGDMFRDWRDVLSGHPFFVVEGWKIQSISAKFEGISLEKDGTWTFEVLAKWPIIYCGEKAEIQHLTQLEAVLSKAT